MQAIEELERQALDYRDTAARLAQLRQAIERRKPRRGMLWMGSGGIAMVLLAVGAVVGNIGGVRDRLTPSRLPLHTLKSTAT